MAGINKHIKNKLISTLKAIIALIALLGVIALCNTHEDVQRMEYAERNGCEWVIYGSHDVCR